MVQAVSSDKNDKKERNLRSFVINNDVPSNFDAPWPGGEQCEQDPCRKAYEIASYRTWQTASSR